MRLFKFSEKWKDVVVVRTDIKIILFKLDVGGDGWKNILPVTRHRETVWKHYILTPAVLITEVGHSS